MRATLEKEEEANTMVPTIVVNSLGATSDRTPVANSTKAARNGCCRGGLRGEEVISGFGGFGKGPGVTNIVVSSWAVLYSIRLTPCCLEILTPGRADVMPCPRGMFRVGGSAGHHENWEKHHVRLGRSSILLAFPRTR